MSEFPSLVRARDQFPPISSRAYCTADQRLCFHKDSTIHLHSEYKISSIYRGFRNWSKIAKTDFFTKFAIFTLPDYFFSSVKTEEDEDVILWTA